MPILPVVVVGLRVALLACSEGTNDIRSWRVFGEAVLQQGVLETYRTHPLFNHPPLMGWLAALAVWCASATHLPFAVLFKLVPVAADLGAAALIPAAVRANGGSRAAGTAAAAAYLWSPVAILIAAHHGNTDSLLAFGILLAALLAASGRPLLSGLSLGCAVNVKIVAVFLVPALLLQQRGPRRAALFAAGLSLGALPFLPVVLHVWPAFYRNAIAYNSNLEHWGIPLLLLQAQGLLPASAALAAALEWYRAAGRYLIALAAAGTGLLAYLGRLGAFDAAALTLALFLVLSPGFGIQYCVWLLPVLFVSSFRHAVAYSVVAGAFVLIVYLHFLEARFPAFSYFTSRFPAGAAVVGVLAWLVLIDFAHWTLRRAFEPLPGGPGRGKAQDEARRSRSARASQSLEAGSSSTAMASQPRSSSARRAA